jgi:hypothetical protein
MTNSRLKCTGCKERFPADSMRGFGSGKFHSIDCATTYAKSKQEAMRARQIAKANTDTKKAEKVVREKHRAAKESLKTAGSYIKEAQASVNKYIRLRDYGEPCISCGNSPAQKYGGTVDAGHYRSRGAAGHLRFNTFNIHGQCVKCNRYNSGNAVDYRLRLIVKIGIERVERLESDNSPRKFTIDYLKRVKKIFNKRARLLQARIDKAN